MHRSILASAIAAATLVAACGPNYQQMHDQLRTRAAFDLSCPEPKLDIVDLDSASTGVSGCGKRATYLGICNAFRCTWLRQGGQ